MVEARVKEICRPPCYGSESGICDRSGRGCESSSRGFQGGFVVSYMLRHHRGVRYDLERVPKGGWLLIAQHPATGRRVTLDISADRPLHGDKARLARELANSIDTLLAPDESWRLHADYV